MHLCPFEFETNGIITDFSVYRCVLHPIFIHRYSVQTEYHFTRSD